MNDHGPGGSRSGARAGGEAPHGRVEILPLGSCRSSKTHGNRLHHGVSTGDEIPDGPLAFRSSRDPVPLSELERMLVLSAMGGSTGWHYSITRHARYAPHLSNCAAGAAGRTFPSAAGFHTAELFFTARR